MNNFNYLGFTPLTIALQEALGSIWIGVSTFHQSNSEEAARKAAAQVEEALGKLIDKADTFRTVVSRAILRSLLA